MVANLALPRSASTHDPGPNVVFVKASGDPAARRARASRPRRGRDGTSVKNIRQQTAQTVSSITTVDLRGISRIEEAFVIVLAAAAMALFVARRARRAPARARDDGRARRVAARRSPRSSGARPRSCSPPRSRSRRCSAGCSPKMLVAMLQHVFDPPPDHLAVPWAFLGGAGAAPPSLGGALAARARAHAGSARLPLGAILREE